MDPREGTQEIRRKGTRWYAAMRELTRRFQHVIISSMAQTITAIAKSFINLLYPLHCAGCGKALDSHNQLSLCGHCKSAIRLNPRPPECGAYSACLYDGVLKELVHLFKYSGKLSLTKALQELMIDFVKETPEIIQGIDMITFIPLQTRRLRERGFNQSEVLAFNIAKELGLSLKGLLEKTISTRHQNELSREDRLINLKGAFRIKNGVSIKGLQILLIDDVMTTGATLSECAKVLGKNGAKAVRCLTLARGL